MPNRLRGWDYASPGAYFVTVCTHLRRPLFGVVDDEVVRHSRLGRDVASQLVEVIGNRQGLCLDAFVVMPDHVHMMIAIPPKYAVSQVIGFIKGKSAIHLARVYGERRRNFVGQHFWARGYFVSTVGRDEEVIRQYIRNQESEDQRLDQMNLWR